MHSNSGADDAGKLTTHRALAEDVLAKVRAELPRPVSRHVTRTRALPGTLTAADRDALRAELSGRFGERRAQRLLRVYGKAAAGVAELAARPELAGTLGDSDVLTAELTHALYTDRELWERAQAGVLDIARNSFDRGTFRRTLAEAMSYLGMLPPQGVFDGIPLELAAARA